MCCAHGAGLLGNAHPAIDEALRKATEVGYANAFETMYHYELAKKLCECVPCADKIRFVSAGTEATMHLIRVCRGYTGKNKIIRIEGHFHGYHEMIYIGGQPPENAFARNRVHPYIESAGIPQAFADLIIPIPFNDIDALAKAVQENKDDTALVILEPINFNSGGIMPEPGYLEYLREITQKNGVILFFDEIQSAFKNSAGGVQSDFGVIPDVCTIGKAIGGGFPLSPFCGRKEIMDHVKPIGNVQHSGTFNAALVPILTGLAFVDEAVKPEFYAKLQTLGAHLYSGLDAIIEKYEANMVIPRYGARFNILLGRKTPAVRYEDTFCHSKETMFELIQGMMEQGIYLHDYGGGPAHHGYSVQHTPEDIDGVLSAFEHTVRSLKDQGKV